MTSPAKGSSLPLATLLNHAADAVQAVRAGRSLTTALAACAPAARPGAQALSFHALRWLGSAQVLRAGLAPKAPPPSLDALLLTALSLLWPPGGAPYSDHTLVDQAVRAARSRPGSNPAFVNAVLRRFVRERDARVAAALRDPLALYNHPRWWIERLRRDWPGEADGSRAWQAILDANNRRAPMTLRVNARRGSAADYVARLARDGILAHGHAGWHAAASPAGPPDDATGAQAVTLQEPRPVPELPGFAEGDVSVQDGAAQRAAPLLLAAGLAPGALVLDACAAPGGKTAHLLELAELDLLALDADPSRLVRVDETLARLGLRARTLAADAADPKAWWDGRPFDAILLDAPCSASGIVRRHPDVRWLRRDADIDALAATQDRLLDSLWPLLARGGRLLYGTCSVFKAEGQDRIDAFLQRRPDARPVAAPASPGHLLPLPDNADGGSEPGAVGDGFFYALIEKT